MKSPGADARSDDTAYPTDVTMGSTNDALSLAGGAQYDSLPPLQAEDASASDSLDNPGILDSMGVIQDVIDALETRDLRFGGDTTRSGPDTSSSRLDVQSDLQTGLDPDAGSSGGKDLPTLPKDVTVFTAKDYGAADDQCIAATPGWTSLVGTFLAEDQKCWGDSDCTYVSFSDACGTICVLPMNQQRIGEFGKQVYGYASASCSSCPRAPNYPTCPPPTAVFCNAGRCEYKRS